MATAVLQQSGPRVFGNHGNIEALTAEDFETASIHSAAPSYVSEVPSYHTIPREATPAYSPPEQSSPPSYSFNSHRSQRRTATTASIDYYANNSSRPSLIPPADSVDEPTIGLPPVPTGPLPAIAPQLSAFRIPSWSSLAANNPITASTATWRSAAPRPPPCRRRGGSIFRPVAWPGLRESASWPRPRSSAATARSRTHTW
ncbi:hypothetical protein MCOR02_000272 [Pyricularia oryzae]|nr:hypothetical protein MCOR02_000272 [Pyricularia oryzae]